MVTGTVDTFFLLVGIVWAVTCIVVAILVVRELKRTPEMPEHEAESRAQQEDLMFTVHIPIGEYPEGKELTPWEVLENIRLEEEETEE